MLKDNKPYCDECAQEMLTLTPDEHSEREDTGRWSDFRTARKHLCSTCDDRLFEADPPPCNTECRTRPCERGGDCWYVPGYLQDLPYETYTAPLLDDCCKYCNCSDNNACEGGCHWVAPRVCSACAGKKIDLDTIDQASRELLDCVVKESPLRLIRQPNGWTCAAACVCMITGTTLEEFYAFCGHDGSCPVPFSAQHWMGVHCFNMKELVGYLLKHDYFLGCGGAEVVAEFDPLREILSFQVDWEKQTVIVDAASGPDGTGLHQIFWSHQLGRLVDPLCPEDDSRTFKDYKIVGWWPVVKLHPAK